MNNIKSMKKKIKDFTIEEKNDYCIGRSCRECPIGALEDHSPIKHAGCPFNREDMQEEEIEI